eukprot:CCRYP_000604-RB/>CCRYP_000604-RB protein AED:0.05 eAED:0.05 QI:146/1/1/1/1/1/2/345/138
MLTLLAQTTLRTASRFAPRAAPVAAKAVSARFASRFMSEKPFAVDAPDGEHDLQDIEESSTWAKRTVDLASVTEDTKTINEIHDAVLGKQMFAVDAPDGEHDLEDVVSLTECTPLICSCYQNSFKPDAVLLICLCCHF